MKISAYIIFGTSHEATDTAVSAVVVGREPKINT